MNQPAITGIGIISSIGIGREAFRENLFAACSGIKRITSFDTGSHHSNIGGEVEGFDPAQFIPARFYRRLSRISRIAVAASQEALLDSGLVLENMDRDRVAIIMGTSYGSSSHVEDFYLSLLRDGPRGAQPFLFPETVPNAPASHIAMFHGITGPNSTLCQNQISGENALLYAANLLRLGQVDVAIVGGAEELSRILYTCYDALGALNKIKVEAGEPIRPVPGGGLILGEGAGVLVMETLHHAVDRKAKIYGHLRSGVIKGGFTDVGRYDSEGDHITRSMKQAMAEAGVTRKDIGQIDVSANFTEELDRIEYDQITQFFKRPGRDLMITPQKYLLGDFGGAGLIRAASILMSIRDQKPLPTIDIEDLLREGPGDLLWKTASPGTTVNIENTLMTSTTFGGGSACLIFSRGKDRSPS